MVLSVLPLVGLFTHVLEILAPEYFECGPASLEAACHHIDQWPDPTPGNLLALPLLGRLLHARIPSTADKAGLLAPTPCLSVSVPNQVQVNINSAQLNFCNRSHLLPLYVSTLPKICIEKFHLACLIGTKNLLICGFNLVFKIN